MLRAIVIRANAFGWGVVAGVVGLYVHERAAEARALGAVVRGMTDTIRAGAGE